MATVEQIRAMHEAMIKNFQQQPMRSGQVTEAPQRAVTNAKRVPHIAKTPSKTKSDHPPPSSEVEEFIARALGNPAFRRLIERLARE